MRSGESSWATWRWSCLACLLLGRDLAVDVVQAGLALHQQGLEDDHAEHAQEQGRRR